MCCIHLRRGGGVDLDEDRGDGGVAPLLGQPLRLVQLEVRVLRGRRRRGRSAICGHFISHFKWYGFSRVSSQVLSEASLSTRKATL